MIFLRRFRRSLGIVIPLRLGAAYPAHSRAFPGARDGKSKYHRYSVLLHSIYTCAATPPDLVTRLAGLLHDIAKPMVWLQNGNMHGHDTLGAPLAEQRLRALGFDHKTAAKVRVLIAAHMFDIDGKARERRVRLQVQRMGYEAFFPSGGHPGGGCHWLGQGAAARLYGGVFQRNRRPHARRGRAHGPGDLAISGADLQEMGLKGRAIGEILGKLVEYCADKPAQNTRQRLLRQAKGLAKSAKKSNIVSNH